VAVAVAQLAVVLLDLQEVQVVEVWLFQEQVEQVRHLKEMLVDQEVAVLTQVQQAVAVVVQDLQVQAVVQELQVEMAV
jgi:hypothetical protein